MKNSSYNKPVICVYFFGSNADQRSIVGHLGVVGDIQGDVWYTLVQNIREILQLPESNHVNQPTSGEEFSFLRRSFESCSQPQN